MDSYDSGFHSDYQVLYADPQDYKEDIRSEKQPTEDGKMKEHDIDCERLPWFHAPLSESPSLTSVQTEDLEEEILRINKFTTRHEDKVWETNGAQNCSHFSVSFARTLRGQGMCSKIPAKT